MSIFPSGRIVPGSQTVLIPPSPIVPGRFVSSTIQQICRTSLGSKTGPWPLSSSQMPGPSIPCVEFMDLNVRPSAGSNLRSENVIGKGEVFWTCNSRKRRLRSVGEREAVGEWGICTLVLTDKGLLTWNLSHVLQVRTRCQVPSSFSGRRTCRPFGMTVLLASRRRTTRCRTRGRADRAP